MRLRAQAVLILVVAFLLGTAAAPGRADTPAAPPSAATAPR
jgi:hypothetical protein